MNLHVLLRAVLLTPHPDTSTLYSMSLHSKEIRAFKGPAATRRAIQELYKTRVGGPAREMCNMLQSALLKKVLHFSEKKKISTGCYFNADKNIFVKKKIICFLRIF